MCTRAPIHMHTCALTHTCTHPHRPAHVTHTCAHTTCTHVHLTHAPTHMYICASTHVHPHTHVHPPTRIHVHPPAHMHTCTHPHTCTRAPTPMHACTLTTHARALSEETLARGACVLHGSGEPAPVALVLLAGPRGVSVCLLSQRAWRAWWCPGRSGGQQHPGPDARRARPGPPVTEKGGPAACRAPAGTRELQAPGLRGTQGGSWVPNLFSF